MEQNRVPIGIRGAQGNRELGAFIHTAIADCRQLRRLVDNGVGHIDTAAFQNGDIIAQGGLAERGERLRPDNRPIVPPARLPDGDAQ